jgi:hypothetical protein
MTTIKESIISMYETLGLELAQYDIKIDALDESKINEYLAYIDWYFDGDLTVEEYQRNVESFMRFKGLEVNPCYKKHEKDINNLIARYIKDIKYLIN